MSDLMKEIIAEVIIWYWLAFCVVCFLVRYDVIQFV